VKLPVSTGAAKVRISSNRSIVLQMARVLSRC
jgi:hypothetical protein